MDTKEKERARRSQRAKRGAAVSRSGTKAKTDAGRKSASSQKTVQQPKKTAGKQETRKTPEQKKVPQQRIRSTQRSSVRGESRNAVKERQQTAAGNRRRRATQQEKKRTIAQDVVYLPPKPFSRNRLLLRLASMVAVVLALVLGISVFFKVETVMVSGNQKYSAEAILEASGIQLGDNLLTFSRAKAGGKIIGTLPFVEKVRFGIKLPGTVNIEITEVEVGYAAADANGSWWLISSAGKVLEQLSSGANSGYTNILGIHLDAPSVGGQARALEEQTTQTDEAGNPIPIAVTAEKRLRTALNILQYLEQNGIIGEAASVDVTELGDIRMQYGRKYQVKLGDDTQLGYKISVLKAAVAKVAQEYPYSTGMLDISDPENINYKQDKT